MSKKLVSQISKHGREVTFTISPGDIKSGRIVFLRRDGGVDFFNREVQAQTVKRYAANIEDIVKYGGPIELWEMRKGKFAVIAGQHRSHVPDVIGKSISFLARVYSPGTPKEFLRGRVRADHVGKSFSSQDCLDIAPQSNWPDVLEEFNLPVAIRKSAGAPYTVSSILKGLRTLELSRERNDLSPKVCRSSKGATKLWETLTREEIVEFVPAIRWWTGSVLDKMGKSYSRTLHKVESWAMVFHLTSLNNISKSELDLIAQRFIRASCAERHNPISALRERSSWHGFVEKWMSVANAGKKTHTLLSVYGRTGR